MSIGDRLFDAILGVLDELYNEVGQRDERYDDEAWIEDNLMPVLTAMTMFIHEEDCEGGNLTGAHPLVCLSCHLTFPDVLQAWHHLNFSSAHDTEDLATVAMRRASARQEILSSYRGDLFPIGEEAISDDMDGMAEIVDVEGFVLSIPADCDDCRGLRDRLSAHVHAVHPKINPE